MSRTLLISTLLSSVLLAGCGTGYYAKLQNSRGEIRTCNVDTGHAAQSKRIYERCLGSSRPKTQLIENWRFYPEKLSGALLPFGD